MVRELERTLVWPFETAGLLGVLCSLAAACFADLSVEVHFHLAH
jgi:hypothetical protein